MSSTVTPPVSAALPAPRIGRPPEAGVARTVKVECRVTAEERDALRRLTERRRTTDASLLRELIHRELRQAGIEVATAAP